MSYYTTELRYLCEKVAGCFDSPPSYQSTDFVIWEAAKKVFGDYPIFDEVHRQVLNNKILKHYYFQEIGFETEGRFLFELNRKMNEIMPYYNKLYQSELLDFDPFENVNYKEIYDGNGDYRKTGEYGKDGTYSKNGEFGNAMKGDGTQTYGKKTVETRNLMDTNTTEFNGDKTDTTSGSGNSSITYGKQTTTSDVNSNTHSDTANGSFKENTDTTNETKNKYLATPETSITALENNDYLTDYRIINEKGKINKNGSNNNTSSGKSNDTRDITTTESGSDRTTYSDSGTSHVVTNDNGHESGSHTGSVTTDNSGTDRNTQNQTENGTNSETGSNNETGDSREIGDDKKHYEKTLKGNTGQPNLDVLQKLRDSFLNIDMMIIDDLSTLFMSIY